MATRHSLRSLSLHLPLPPLPPFPPPPSPPLQPPSPICARALPLTFSFPASSSSLAAAIQPGPWCGLVVMTLFNSRRAFLTSATSLALVIFILGGRGGGKRGAGGGSAGDVSGAG